MRDKRLTLEIVAREIIGNECSKKTLIKAQWIRDHEAYGMDYPQMETMRLYFYKKWAIYDSDVAIFDLMQQAFNLGYLKGGRAALRGKFKEPARKRNQKV